MAEAGSGTPKPDWQKEIEKEVTKPVITTKENGAESTNNEWLTAVVKEVGKMVYNAILSSIAKNDYNGSIVNNLSEVSDTVKSGLPILKNYSRVIYLKIDGFRSQYIYTNNDNLAYTRWNFAPSVVRFKSTFDKITLDSENSVKTFFNTVSDSPNEFYQMFQAIPGTLNKPTREEKRDFMALFETAIHFGKNSRGWIENTKVLNGGILPTKGTTGGTTDGTGTGTTSGTETSPGTPIMSNIPLIGLALVGLGLLFTNSKKTKK
jgi:hypothetical protein